MAPRSRPARTLWSVARAYAACRGSPLTTPTTKADPHRLDDLDALLLRIARHRDRGAFAALFEQVAPRLGGFFARSGLDPVVRDELVQEVLLRVWRKAHLFDPARARATTWIFAIARNARIDHLRRPAVQAQVSELDPTWVDDASVPADRVVAQRQVADGVRAALEALPSEQAAILEAAYFEHKTLKAIATEAGIALGTVKSRVRLAFHRLRGTLDGIR